MLKPIRKPQVQQTQKENRVVRLIDIRPADEYEQRHVAGSINIPADQLSNQAKQFAKNDTIVCICTHGKERSHHAAEFLYDAGFENTFYLEGGIAKWYENDSAKE